MKKYSILILLIIILHASTALAQYRLLGARQAAVGECGLGIADVWATSHNQAAMALIDQTTAGAYYEDRFNMEELSLKAAALVYPTRYGSIGASFSSFGSVDYSENKAGLAFSKKLGSRFMLGIQLDYFLIDQPLGYGSAMAFTTEVGLLTIPFDGLEIGAQLFNPTKVHYSQFNDNYLSEIARFGAKYEIGGQVRLMAEISKDILMKSVYCFGLEYDLLKNLSLRYGYRTVYASNSFGLGVRLSRFILDVGASQFAGLGWDTHWGVQYQFAASNLKAKTF